MGKVEIVADVVDAWKVQARGRLTLVTCVKQGPRQGAA